MSPRTMGSLLMPPLGPGRCSDHDNVVSESAVSGIQLINARQFGYTSQGPGSLPGGKGAK